MMYFSYCGDDSPNTQLKVDSVAAWMEQQWIPQHPEHDWTIIRVQDTALEMYILEQFTENTELANDYRFKGQFRAETSTVPYVSEMMGTKPRKNVGTFLYRFQRDMNTVDVLVVSTYTSDTMPSTVSLACVPEGFMTVWNSFLNECNKIAYPPDRVRVIGGSTRTVKTDVVLEDIILPQKLKDRIVSDVDLFFEEGVAIYNDMKLNPFRKLLLAGVPGTGKTMLCNALANRALDKKYLVIYISSASRSQGERDGANFWKIQEGLRLAANVKRPALMVIEELDAYLKAEEKALILNVLDGVEGIENEAGTLLIATTNYPEAIDERVLKRPGRLDRIYVVPPIVDKKQAEAMLHLYLRRLWRDEHRELADEVVGYPGSFVREVVIYAVTRMIEAGKRELTLDDLRESIRELKAQLEDRDELVRANQNGGVGQAVKS